MRIASIVLATSLAVFPTSVRAQLCMGGVPFEHLRAQFAADASLNAAGQSAVGSLSAGTSKGLFASFGLGTAHNDSPHDAAPQFAAMAGLGRTYRSQSERRTQICPFLSMLAVGELAAGDTVTIDGHRYRVGTRTSQAYGLGFSVGTVRRSGTSLDLVPFASATVVARNTDLHVGALDYAIGDHYYAVSLGAGLVAGEEITVRPSVTFTWLERRTNPTYGVRMAFSFGHSTAQPAKAEEGSVTTVWLDTRRRVYYCPGSPSYGATPKGRFVTEREAIGSGATPAQGGKC